MKRLIPFDKNDPNRALLTDTLPYETPLIFSNDFFYWRVLNGDVAGGGKLLRHLLTPESNYTIPYTFCARLSDKAVRHLSVMHPSAQVECKDFYSRYDSMILDRCSVSNFSIRRPVGVASGYFENESGAYANELRDSHPEVEVDPLLSGNQFASSYFSYRSCSRIYEFFLSQEYIDLEKRFSRMARFDVAKCFYNIYTHSIAWAVKNRRYAKQNKERASFETVFDSLMMRANFGETNGVIVGPEVSRIFAELIFQDIDVRAERILEDKGHVVGRDYQVRRYIDDHFVFTNSEREEREVLETFSGLLSQYKLFFNEAKTQYKQRPFATSLSAAKTEILEYLDSFFGAIIEPVEGAEGQKSRALRVAREHRWRWSAKDFIGRYRTVVAKYDLSYTDVSGFVGGIVRQRLLSFARKRASGLNRSTEERACLQFLTTLTEIVFFVATTDIRARTLDIAAQSLVLLDEIAEGYDETIGQVFREIVEKEVSDTFLADRGMTKACSAPNEFSGFLPVVAYLTKRKAIPESALRQVWEHVVRHWIGGGELSGYPYFVAISMLYYAGDGAEYEGLKESIIDELVSYVEEPRFYIDAAVTMATLDFVSCPYVDKDVKNRLIRAAWRSTFGEGPSTHAIGQFRNFVSKRQWFVDWGGKTDIRRALFKKELRRAY